MKHIPTGGMIAGGILGTAIGVIPTAFIALALSPVSVGGGGSGNETVSIAVFSVTVVGFTGLGVAIGSSAGIFFFIEGSCDRFLEHKAALESMTLLKN